MSGKVSFLSFYFGSSSLSVRINPGTSEFDFNRSLANELSSVLIEPSENLTPLELPK